MTGAPVIFSNGARAFGTVNGSTSGVGAIDYVDSSGSITAFPLGNTFGANAYGPGALLSSGEAYFTAMNGGANGNGLMNGITSSGRFDDTKSLYPPSGTTGSVTHPNGLTAGSASVLFGTGQYHPGTDGAGMAFYAGGISRHSAFVEGSEVDLSYEQAIGVPASDGSGYTAFGLSQDNNNVVTLYEVTNIGGPYGGGGLSTLCTLPSSAGTFSSALRISQPIQLDPKGNFIVLTDTALSVISSSGNTISVTPFNNSTMTPTGFIENLTDGSVDVFSSTGGAYNAGFDDLVTDSGAATPEPSSASLLMLGALPLLRRRRRVG